MSWIIILNNKRVCSTCKESVNKNVKNCDNENHKKYIISRNKSGLKNYYKNRDKRLKMNYEHGIKRKYNLKIEDYYNLLKEQNNKCKICKKEFNKSIYNMTPHVDHNHKTGEVRGLLCRLCNLGIGWIEKLGISTCNEYLNNR